MIIINSLEKGFEFKLNDNQKEIKPKAYEISVDGYYSSNLLKIKNVYNGEIIASGFRVDGITVDGTIYTTFEALSGALADVLFNKGGGSGGGGTGTNGWTPLFVDVADGARIVRQLSSYFGGTGTAPTLNVGKYLKSDGTYTSVIADALDYKGVAGEVTTAQLNTKADKQLGQFIYPTLLNGWQNINAFCFYKDSFGIVHFEGALGYGFQPATLFILPEGFRPGKSLYVPVYMSDEIVQIRIFTTGEVLIEPSIIGNNTWLMLSLIKFRVF